MHTAAERTQREASNPEKSPNVSLHSVAVAKPETYRLSLMDEYVI